MKLIFKIIKGIITAFLAVVLVLVIFQKFTNNKIAIGNIYIFEVASESMFPEYKIGDIIVTKKTDPSLLKVGDDVTYHGVSGNFNGMTITHRIISVRDENGKYYFVTKGIMNSIEDPEISQDELYGKVIYHTVLFSFVGRLMTNIVIYYLLCISIGVAFFYELITSFIIKDKEEDDESDEDGDSKK